MGCKRPKPVYEASNYHKRNPSAWNLEWPNPPRPLTSKCEDLFLIQKYAGPESELMEKIKELLICSFEKGTFSAGIEKGWPACLWAITGEDQIVEAHRGTRGSGKYHGYPFKSTRSLEDAIRNRWNNP